MCLVPFMFQHLAAASLHPTTPHQIEASRRTHTQFIPRGGGLTQSKCTSVSLFLLRFPSIPAPVTRLSSPDSQDTERYDTVFFRKRVESYLCHTSGFTCNAKGYKGVIDLLVGGHDRGGTVESLRKALCR